MKLFQVIQDDVIAKIAAYVKAKTGQEFTVEELLHACDSTATKLPPVIKDGMNSVAKEPPKKRVSKIPEDEQCKYQVGGKNPHRCNSKAVQHGYCNACLKKSNVRKELGLDDGTATGGSGSKGNPGGFAKPPGIGNIPVTGLSQGIPDLSKNNDLVREGDRMFDRKRGFVLRPTGTHGEYYCEGKRKEGSTKIEPLSKEDEKVAMAAGYKVISPLLQVPAGKPDFDALGIDDEDDLGGSDIELQDEDEE